MMLIKLDNSFLSNSSCTSIYYLLNLQKQRVNVISKFYNQLLQAKFREVYLQLINYESITTSYWFSH